MKDEIVIVGGGRYSKNLISTIKKIDKYNILGYTDLSNKGLLLGIKYLGTDQVLKEIIKQHKNCNAVIGIESFEISNRRQEIYRMLKDVGFELPVIFSNNVSVNEEVMIGEGTVLLEGAIIKTSSKIGKCVIINTGTIVSYDCVVGDFVNLAAGSIIGAESEIGDNCIIEVGAKVIQNKKVCNNSLIGPGAIVLRDIITEGIYNGVPARKIIS